MATTEAPKRGATKRKPAAAQTSDAVKEHNARMNAGNNEEDKERARLKKAEKQDRDGLNALEPGAGDTPGFLDKFSGQKKYTENKRWYVGKTPEVGGTDKQWSIFTQEPLGFMGRNRWFAIVSAAMSKAIRATGGQVAGMGDVFGNMGSAASIRERVGRLAQRDWQDASTFFAMFMELVAYVPDVLVESYMIWLDIPDDGTRDWVREGRFFEVKWDPDNGKYGFTDEEHEEILNRFIDQNYEEIRRFFTETLPRTAARVADREKERADRESESVPSKPSNTSGQREAVTS